MPWWSQSYDAIDREKRLHDIMVKDFKSMYINEPIKDAITIFAIPFSEGFVTYYLHLPDKDEIIHAFLYFVTEHKFKIAISPVGKYKLYREAGDGNYIPSLDDK